MKQFFQKIFSYINQTELSVLFFLIFVFLLPFKRKIEILTDYSFLESKFMDYLTVSFYGFEIFLVIALVIWVIKGMINKEKFSLGNKKIFFSLLIIFLFSIISLFFATSLVIGFYYLIVFLECILLYLFVVNKLKSKKDIFVFLNIFLLAIFLQSILGIIQFWKNESIGFYFFGESLISPAIQGVAKTIFEGVKHIRSYGTFPHSNILALYLLIGGLINLYLINNTKNLKYKIFLVVIFIFLFVAIILTFSRVIWILAVIFWSLYFLKRYDIKSKIKKYFFKKDFRNISFFALLILFFTFIIIYFFPAIWWRVNPILNTTWDSWQSRLVVIKESFVLFKNNFFGVGIGNFCIEIAYQLTNKPLWMIEPVHNNFLIVLVELGIFGFLSFISLFVFVFKNFKNISLYLKYIFCSLFIYMFFDHCFWDIRQAQILLFLFISLISVYPVISEKRLV